MNVLVMIGTFFFKMTTTGNIARKFFKVLLWTIISIFLLLVTIALLIRIPAIQNKLIGYATSYISKKTHTKVEIGEIRLEFPKTLNLRNVFLDDLQKDTLLFAENIDINISIFSLLKQEANIEKIGLDNVSLNLSRKETDTLFNYNFLLTAFSDPDKKESTDTSGSQWKISLDDIILNNISLRYADGFGGTDVKVVLGKLKLSMKDIDLEKRIFEADKLEIADLRTVVLLKKQSQSGDTNEESSPPSFTAGTIEIRNTSILFADSVSKRTIKAYIDDFSVNKFAADINKQSIYADKLKLSGSNAEYVQADSSAIKSSTNKDKQDNWHAEVKKILLEKNKFSYSLSYLPKRNGTFDPAHISYHDISLQAEDVLYSTEKTEAKLKQLSSKDLNGHFLENMSVDFYMDPHSIRTKGLKVKTRASSIDADIEIGYTSLSSLKDSIQFMKINADLRKTYVSNSDVVYFAPELKKISFFQSTTNVTSLSGKVNGQINNLRGKNMNVRTGSGTTVKTDFIIAGLPYPELTYFNLPNLKVNSGRKDIEMIAGRNNIPENISIPEQISLQIDFKGKIKEFTTTAGFSSSYGSGNLYAIIDKKENFTAKAAIKHFDLGRLLKNPELFGPVSIVIDTKGQGLDKNTIKANLHAEASEFFLNKYTYSNLLIDGNITGQKFDGNISINDPNIVFDFKGFVDLNKNHEEYKFNLDLKGADLQKLHLSDKDLRIGLVAVSDLKGNSASTIHGKAGITSIVIGHNEKKYILDSLLFASVNEKGKSELNVSSAIIGIKYNGTFSPADAPKEIQKFIDRYFLISDERKDTTGSTAQNFSFEIELRNHPVLNEVFFPELKTFEPGTITGSFNSEKQELKVDASIKELVYGATDLRNFSLNINSAPEALNYSLACAQVSNSQIKLENIRLNGSAANNKITNDLSSTDENNVKKIRIGSSLTREKDTYTIRIDPENFYIMDEKWNVAADNFVSFNKGGVLLHNVALDKSGSSIRVYSVNDRFNDDLQVMIKNLQIAQLSRIVEKDTSLARGSINGNILLKRINKTYGIIADMSVNDLFIKEVPVGNLSLKADNPSTERYDLEASLTGPGNDVRIKGYYLPKAIDNAISINADINSLNLKTVEVLSMKKITSATGTASGRFEIRGKSSAPDITGNLTFKNSFITAAALNSKLELKNETIEMKEDGIYFNSFTIYDSLQNKAVISGNIKMKQFRDPKFNLEVNARNFLLFNTTSEDNKIYYGKMIVNSRMKISGDLNLPVVNGKVKLRKGSNFTFSVPEKKLTTDKGEGVVIFTDSTTFHPIITKGDKQSEEKTEIRGFNISSIIEVDEDATLKLIIDPYSGDSLVVRGDAALNFSLDPSGKMSLTGAYNLKDGSYLVSLESVLKRQFNIAPGSTIIWNGDPLDATLNINAVYSVRASPADLVADQLAGLSETEQAAYKQRFPFEVILNLKGELLHPEISFEIQLAPEEKGILGGTVNAKLNMLNEDESALNKQVFALLVLGRFIQEDPLQSAAGGVSTVARTTVSKFLSAQLNQLSSKVIPGVELNFDVQSYDDYGNGTAEGRTEVEVGIKKQLFDERLTVQVGGSVDVEGEKAKQNSASDITSDVTLEYKLSKDGRYRLKGFRHNQYEGAIEGQLVETGAGLLYIKDFDKWKDFFKPNRKRRERPEKNTK
jgi:hypothetical protein